MEDKIWIIYEKLNQLIFPLSGFVKTEAGKKYLSKLESLRDRLYYIKDKKEFLKWFYEFYDFIEKLERACINPEEKKKIYDSSVEILNYIIDKFGLDEKKKEKIKLFNVRIKTDENSLIKVFKEGNLVISTFSNEKGEAIMRLDKGKYLIEVPEKKKFKVIEVDRDMEIEI